MQNSVISKRRWLGWPTTDRRSLPGERSEAGFFFGCFEEFGLEGHSESQSQGREVFFDFVERFLAEVAILEHLRFALHRELADSRDIRVVQAVGGANAELDFVDAHVEE